MKISRIDTKKSSVMVVAPHPDDETIGAGGIIIQTMINGGDVKVIYLTTGISGQNIDPEKITAREKEAISAMKLSGVDEKKLFFLRYNSTELTKKKIFYDCIRKISRIIKDSIPDYIFMPAYEGGHVDHDATNYIIYKILIELKLDGIHIFEYAGYTSCLKMDIISIKRILRKIMKGVPFFNFRFPNDFISHNRLSQIPAFQLNMSYEELYLKLEMLRQYSSQDPGELVFWHGFPDRFREFFPYNYTELPYKTGFLAKTVYFIGEKLKKPDMEYRIAKNPPALYLADLSE